MKLFVFPGIAAPGNLSLIQIDRLKVSIISREETSKGALMSLILGFSVHYSRILCDLGYVAVIFLWGYNEVVKMVL